MTFIQEGDLDTPYENIDKMNNLDKRARMVRNHAYVMMKLRQEQRKVNICGVIKKFDQSGSHSRKR